MITAGIAERKWQLRRDAERDSGDRTNSVVPDVNAPVLAAMDSALSHRGHRQPEQL
jgi:hypothetical protein